jgi:uncharacterized membrane-anchored protein
MQDAMVWGPFIIKKIWIVIAFSGLAAFTVMKYRLKGRSDPSKRIIDDIVNVLILAILIWKFSLIIFNPLIVVQNPYAILYFTGGERGAWLSVVGVLCFLYFRSKKRNFSIWIYADTVVVGFLSFYSIYSFLYLIAVERTQTFTFNLSQFCLTIGLLIWLYRRQDGFAKPYDINQVALWFSIGQIFSYSFKDYNPSVLWGVSKEQLSFLFIALFCLVLSMIKKKE